MARRGEAMFLREDEVPAAAGDLVVRNRSLGWLAAATGLLASAAIGPAILFVLFGDDFERLWSSGISGASAFRLALAAVVGAIALAISLISLLVALFAAANFAAARRPTNWVLRVSADTVYLKLRSFLDHRLPRDDRVVVAIPKRGLRGLRAHSRLARAVGSDGEGRGREDDAPLRQHYMEIALRDVGDAAAIAAALAEERKRWRPSALPGARVRATGAPVGIAEDGIIRIDWHTKATRLGPSLATALKHLAVAYPAVQARESEEAEIRRLDRAGQEDRLRQMMRDGRRIDAVILAQTLYGLDMTEAKALLDGLCPEDG